MMTLDELTNRFENGMNETFVVIDENFGLVNRFGLVGVVLTDQLYDSSGTKLTNDVRDIHDGPRVARVENGSQSTSGGKRLDEVVVTIP